MLRALTWPLRASWRLYRWASGIARQYVVLCLAGVIAIPVLMADIALTSTRAGIAITDDTDDTASQYVDEMTDRWARWWGQVTRWMGR